MMITFNHLMSRALLILNAKLKKENSADRIGGLFRDLLFFCQDMMLGIILKGEKANQSAIKATANPKRGDTFKAADNGHYWCFDGATWNDIGQIIPPSEALTKDNLTKPDDTFSFCVQDSSGFVPFAIHKDGSIFVDKINELLSGQIGIDSLKDDLRDTLSKLSNNSIQLSASDEFALIVQDENKNILWALRKDGSSTSSDPLTAEIKKIEEQISFFDHIQFSQSENRLEMKDSHNNLAFVVFGDGTSELETMITVLIKQLEDKINKLDVSRNRSNETTTLKIPIAGALPAIELCEIPDLNALPTMGRVKFRDNYGNSFEVKARIDLQGSSSRAYPKKNLKLDLFSVDGDPFFIQFGNWISTDSFNVKANWIDATHARNICSLRLFMQIYETFPTGKQRAWQRVINPGTTEINNRFDSGATGHPDGFGIEIFHNGLYYGLGTLSLNKSSKNYNMTRNNPNHILMQSLGVENTFEFVAREWEFINPAGINTGQTPPEPILSCVNRLFDWIKLQVRSWNQSVWDKSNPAAYIDLDYWRAYYIMMYMCRATDVIKKNILMGTYDGSIWFAFPYDWDATYGLTPDGTRIVPADDNQIFWSGLLECIRRFDAKGVESMYARLRNTVLSTDNVAKTFTEFYKPIGQDAYLRDFARWKQIPSNGLSCTTDFRQITTWWQDRLKMADIHFKYN